MAEFIICIVTCPCTGVCSRCIFRTVLYKPTFYVSALLRRGTAYKGLKMYDKAKKDFKDVLVKEPNNKKAEVTNLLNLSNVGRVDFILFILVLHFLTLLGEKLNNL